MSNFNNIVAVYTKATKMIKPTCTRIARICRGVWIEIRDSLWIYKATFFLTIHLTPPTTRSPGALCCSYWYWTTESHINIYAVNLNLFASIDPLVCIDVGYLCNVRKTDEQNFDCLTLFNFRHFLLLHMREVLMVNVQVFQLLRDFVSRTP
jgi:hypothetical protein